MGAYFRGVRYPKYCCNCGEELNRDYDEYTRFDWDHKNSCTCDCGTQYVKADLEDLKDDIRDELTQWDKR